MEKPNIDLLKINIDELEEVTEGYWSDGEWLLLFGGTQQMYIEKVVSIVPKNECGITVDDFRGGNCYDSNIYQVYKLPPKPQKQLPTRDEAMWYLKMLDKKASESDGVVLVKTDKEDYKFSEYWEYTNTNLGIFTIGIHARNGLIEGSEHSFYDMREV